MTKADTFVSLRQIMPESASSSSSNRNVGRAPTAVAWLLFVLVIGMVTSSLYVIAVAGWTTLFSDQWRIYNTYFSQPFPESLLVSQNGHHPVFPGLLFFADIYLAGARNYLINTLGIVFALFVCIWWSRVIRNDRELDRPLKLAAIALVWLSVFWLGNARVLVHGNESLHVYPIFLALFSAASALHCGSIVSGRATTRRLLIVIAAGAIATFTFGFGIVLWLVAILLGWMLHPDFRQSLALIVSTIAVFGLYVFGLPGDGLARRGLTFTPGEVLVDSATWLGAPFARALQPFAHRAKVFGLPTFDLLTLAAILGGIGLLATALLCIRGLWLRRITSRLEAITTAIVLFGAGCSVLVAIARGEYFNQFPGQVVSPRYVPWSAAFWAALLILGAIGIERWGGRPTLPKGVWLSASLVLTVLLLPTHHGRNSEFKKHQSTEVALGLLVGARDDSMVQQHLFRRPAVVYKVSQVLEQRRWGVFSEDLASILGKPLKESYTIQERPAGRISPGLRVEAVAAVDAPGARLTARLNRAFADRLSPRVLVTDSDGRVVGIGHLRGRRHRLARSVGLLGDIQPSFAVYIAPYSAEKRYTVYGVLEHKDRAAYITSVGPTGPAGEGRSNPESTSGIKGAPVDIR